MKKKYNPFKMWGSWIGAIAGASYIGYKFYQASHPICSQGICMSNPYAQITANIILIPLGFLIGWGINAIWRKYK